MKKIKKGKARSILSLLLALVLLVGVFPHVTTWAEDEAADGDPWLAFGYMGFEWEPTEEDPDVWMQTGDPAFLPYEGFWDGPAWLVEDAANRGYYRLSEDEADKDNAAVIWDYDTRTLTLKNYKADLSQAGVPDEDNGVIPALIYPSNLQDLTIKVVGNCSITYNGTIIGIGMDCDKLSIVKGSDDATLTLTSSGTDPNAPEDEIWPYCPIAFWGDGELEIPNKVTFVNEVILNLTAKDKATPVDWDIEAYVEDEDSFIQNSGIINGIVPGDEVISNIWIDEEGQLNGEADAPVYWKVYEKVYLVESSENDYQIHYDAKTKTLYLKDFVFDGSEGISVYAECDLNLVLDGENKITNSADSALAVERDLNISGSGNLTAITTCAKLFDENGDVVLNEDGSDSLPVAIWIGGTKFSNSSTLTCQALEEAGCDLGLWSVSFDDIQNTGKIYGRYEAKDASGTDLIYEKPVDPKPGTTEKPDDSGKPGTSDGSDASSTPDTTAPVLGKAKTDQAVAQIKNAKEKSKVTIDMKTEDGKAATIIPKDVLEAAKGKDVDVVLQMDGYSWTINGKDITAKTLEDIDLKVTLNTDNIPEKTVKDLANGKKTIQLSVAHNGEFGFTATLTLSLGKEYQGKYGNLYYYNNGKLEFVSAGKIDTDGNVDLKFKHASDYVIVIDDKSAAPKTSDSGMVGIYLLLILLASGVCLLGYFNIRRKVS